MLDGCSMWKPSRRSVVRLGLLLVAAQALTAPHSIAGDKAPLGIGGYDPVAYFTDGKPTRGLPDIAYEWDEHSYRFSRAEHRELFKADPVRYAPQFANYCAMALSRGEVHEANPEHWLISDGKLYIFTGPNGPDRFRRDLTENIDKATRNRALIQKH